MFFVLMWASLMLVSLISVIGCIGAGLWQGSFVLLGCAIVSYFCGYIFYKRLQSAMKAEQNDSIREFLSHFHTYGEIQNGDTKEFHIEVLRQDKRGKLVRFTRNGIVSKYFKTCEAIIHPNLQFEIPSRIPLKQA